MAMNELDALAKVLREQHQEIMVPGGISRKALIPLERMLSFNAR